MAASTEPSLFRAFTTVGGYTLLSRLAGFVREILTATFLGAARFRMRSSSPFSCPTFFAVSSPRVRFPRVCADLSQTLEREGAAKAKQFADQAFAVLSVVLLVFSIIMIIAMPLVLYVQAAGYADDPEQMERMTEMARIAFPYLFFVSLTALQSGVLNALGRFAVPAAAPVFLNITLITALLAGVGSGGDRALFLSWGVFAAGVVQLCGLPSNAGVSACALSW